MKTKITSSLLMLIICITVKAQNLIPNGDFELGPDSSSMGWQYGIWDTTGGGCSPTVFVTGPNLWTVVTGSPDRLVNGHMPPCNWDNDTAQSGNAYAVFGEKFAVATLPEVGKATLLMPLQKDSAYHLSYYVKLETFSHLTFQPVRIAFVFNNNGDSLASSFVSDTIWQYRDTIFMASANSTEIEITGADSSLSAVDVDNVKLEKISSNGVEDYINQEKFNIYPNPVKDILFIERMENEMPIIRVFDYLGNKIDNYTIIKTKKYSLDLSKLSPGIYLINIITQNKNTTKKIILLK